MKYFTMEELDDIAKELIENPSRETLKKLNSKYNSEENSNNTKWVESVPFQMKQTDIGSSIEKNNTVQENTVSEEQNKLPKIDIPTSNIPVWSPAQNTNNTLFNSNNIPNVEENNNTNIPFSGMAQLPNLEIQSVPLNNNSNIPNTEILNNGTNMDIRPSLEMPDTNNAFTNNNPMPFNGNLWEQPNNELNNMMQTTDNFNTPIDQNPFFGRSSSPVNNPIPVSEPPTIEGPTVFGQFEQNYNSNAA